MIFSSNTLCISFRYRMDRDRYDRHWEKDFSVAVMVLVAEI
jgi:hypothetical protein